MPIVCKLCGRRAKLDSNFNYRCENDECKNDKVKSVVHKNDEYFLSVKL